MARPDRTRQFEALILRRMLLLRGRGYSYGQFYRWMLPAYIGLFAVMGAGIAWFVWSEMPLGAALMIGMLIGVVLRDFGYTRVQKRVWPITERITDWDEVERLAIEESDDQ